jgi:glycosyltransferase involved in cell wall biosynthesis
LKPTISVIIPALNEEASIAAAVDEAIATLGDRFSDYELLLFDDGSTDRTGPIMDELAAKNPRIRVTHNPRPNNLGGVYKQGVAMARFDYILMIPGDNENPRSATIPALDAIGKADIIIPYPTNMRVRPLLRRIGSRSFTLLINLLFLRRIKYYNGTVVSRTADLRSIHISTNSFAYQCECLLKLLKTGRTYYEVGIEIQAKPGRKSRALRLRNLIDVFRAICHLFVEVHFRTKKRRTATPHEVSR